MKTFKIAIICMSMMALFSGMALAASGTNNSGAEFTMTDDGTGPGLVFTPSPTTLFSWNMTANVYAITAVSSKTNAANGRQYGVVAGKSPIYELAAVVTNNVVVLTDPTSASTLGGAWEDKAGNSAP